MFSAISKSPITPIPERPNRDGALNVLTGATDIRRAIDHFKTAQAQLAERPGSSRYAVFYIGMPLVMAILRESPRYLDR